MNRDDAGDLLAFLAVARERSFTRAAAKLGMTQSALSQIIRNLEERLGMRLLNRTTRSVTPTQAGERLFASIAPKFSEMDADLAALSELREKPAGTVRLTATEYAASEIVLPALAKLLPKYPDIHVEIVIDYGLTNIVAQQVDAGIRPGELVAKDMIAVRVSPDLRMAVVGSPSYFAARKRPRVPQDLTHHNCLNLRLPTHGGSLYAWEFEKGGRELNVRRRTARLQQRRPSAGRSAQRPWPSLPHGGTRAALPVQRQAGQGVIGLVSAVFGLSFVLSEPPPTLAGLFAPGRGAPLPREIAAAFMPFAKRPFGPPAADLSSSVPRNRRKAGSCLSGRWLSERTGT